MKKLTLGVFLIVAVATAIHATPTLFYINNIPNQTFEGVGTYTYQATTTIQNPGCIASGPTFSMVSGPSGMTISSSGYIQWTGPGYGDTWPVTIKAFASSDCIGVGSYSENESFTLSCQNNC